MLINLSQQYSNANMNFLHRNTLFQVQPVSIFAWLLILLFMMINSSSCSATITTMRLTSSSYDLDDDYKILYYPQTLDHFNYLPESYSTFNQKYVVTFKHWGGAKVNAPILVFLGHEAPLSNSTVTGMILNDFAPHFKALLVFIEHRYYGESKPFGMSMEEILKNKTVRGYFNSAQAIADYAELILYLKRKLNAHHSPVIVMGGSYGGMLASWFRLKYPHVALGALASSAPVRYFDNIISPNHGYFSVVTKNFQETSFKCYWTIRKSWAEIDKVGMKPNGVSILSKKFNTCTELESTSELKDYLQHIYVHAAQYNVSSVTNICDAINNGSKGKDILSRIYAGVVAYSGTTSQCIGTNWKVYSTDTILGWGWQTCTEMVMLLAPETHRNSMFPRETFNLSNFINNCKDNYHVLPRPHWITTYYGGHDMKLILQRFGSNIIFSNGLKDPYSSGGVLRNLSDSILAVYTTNGTHCMDIVAAQKDDPEWLIQQRKTELEIIDGWIEMYYKDIKKLVCPGKA